MIIKTNNKSQVKKEILSTLKSFINLQPFLESYWQFAGSKWQKKKRSLPV
jgi:hypothetical protein